MKNKSQINLITAILININIILGAGLFINPSPLTRFAGSLGFLGYILSAIILLPIVLSIAELAKTNPTSGGLYVYSKKYINPSFGFISGWSYFIGKTASAALLTHTFALFFQRRILFLQTFPTILLDCILISLLILINIVGVQVGGKIQYFFISMKTIPIIFIIFSGLFLFNPAFFTPEKQDFTSLFAALPIAIFVLLSFEMICSIGHLIKKPQKNIKPAIISSFLIVVFVASVFQFIMFGILGNKLSAITEPILNVGMQLFYYNPSFAQIINAFVFASIIGGAFGSLTTNCWNLYTLSLDNHLPGKKFLTKINRTNVPYISLIIEGILACLILIISSNQVALQNTTVLGVVIAYFLSSISLFRTTKPFKTISTFAILSSSYILFICIKNIINYGISSPLLMIFMIGLIFSLYKNKKGLHLNLNI